MVRLRAANIWIRYWVDRTLVRVIRTFAMPHGHKVKRRGHWILAGDNVLYRVSSVHTEDHLPIGRT